MKALPAIMIVGTGSDVGKSVLNAALCRIFKQDGYHPAPFKSQNMSLNSYATPEGLEIGRAQAMQAEAAGIPCHTDMNPVLLKPTNDKSSQVILNGKPFGQQSAHEYFTSGNKDNLFKEAIKAYERLAEKYNPIIIEGAGSISELNLKEKDIVNMKVSLATNAVTFLTGDIDRGGIFGSIYGNYSLLNHDEKAMIKGIIINKFRGDPRLFESGKEKLEEITGLPVIGVLPYFNDINIDEEDSVALEKRKSKASENKINICIILLKRLSNYTDFEIFENQKEINLYYSDNTEEIEKADIIIIPGSKNTIEDLEDLKMKGIDKVITKAFYNNKSVFGICGGYQMMGKKIEDPYQIESEIKSTEGLGILPIYTILEGNKTTIQCQFYFKDNHLNICNGYEIHMGKTVPETNPKPLTYPLKGEPDGYYLNEKCWGTYIHGIFDNQTVLNEVFSHFELSKVPFSEKNMDYKEIQYKKLAELVRNHLDMDKLYSILKNHQ